MLNHIAGTFIVSKLARKHDAQIGSSIKPTSNFPDMPF